MVEIIELDIRPATLVLNVARKELSDKDKLLDGHLNEIDKIQSRMEILEKMKAVRDYVDDLTGHWENYVNVIGEAKEIEKKGADLNDEFDTRFTELSI